MRFVTLILALLVLMLSLLPCTDTNVVHGTENASVHLPPTQQGAGHEDTCPPFCHCACCAIVSIHHEVAPITPLLLPVYNCYADQYTASVTEISIPVWQPPQLA